MKYKPWPKRDPVRNYFQLPNEIFLLGLSPGALAAYSYLLCCANRRTHQCWPSYKTIGAATKMSVNTVHKHVCSLADKGLISTVEVHKNCVAVNKGCLRYKKIFQQ